MLYNVRMILRKIEFSNFRLFKKASFDFCPNLNLIVGENARGKTSLLEGIYSLVYGTGFRETREVELVKWDEIGNLVEGVFKEEEHLVLYQLQIQKTSGSRVEKSFFVDKNKKSSRQYRELQTQAVLFAPEQIQIITGSPSRRRRYFDEVLSAIHKDYRRCINNYERALRRRNKILEDSDDELKLIAEIDYWNTYLIEQSSVITRYRRHYVEYLNSHPEANKKHFTIEYKVDEFTKHRLSEVRSNEFRFRRTLIGPQKDDFTIYLHSPQKKDVSLFGSRSEQRMAIFWLKLVELLYFEERTQKKPILLLDDIFSELDDHNRELVVSLIEKYQTVATTVDEEVIDLSKFSKEVIRL